MAEYLPNCLDITIYWHNIIQRMSAYFLFSIVYTYIQDIPSTVILGSLLLRSSPILAIQSVPGLSPFCITMAIVNVSMEEKVLIPGLLSSVQGRRPSDFSYKKKRCQLMYRTSQTKTSEDSLLTLPSNRSIISNTYHDREIGFSTVPVLQQCSDCTNSQLSSGSFLLRSTIQTRE